MANDNATPEQPAVPVPGAGGIPVPGASAPADPTPADAPQDGAEELGYTELVTPPGAADGMLKCAKCGATQVMYNKVTEELVCEFCRHTWKEQKLDEAMGLSHGIAELKGTTLASAAVDISDDETLMTFDCKGCGAEVVVDTTQNLQARCHWCKNVLSINNRIPNGAVPDGILPFEVTKQQAMASIQEFVDKRKMFASPAFATSFKADNVMGVYMPYMTVDGNVSARLEGKGEILRKTVKRENESTEYHADRYTVARELDLHIDDLIVETSSTKVDIHSTESTNNIINAVLPFDVKNIVRFNSHFLGSEYTSEKRDMNVDAVEDYAVSHFLTIARGAAERSVDKYNRGVRWEYERMDVKGTRWTAVLLPVWLYGFTETKKGKEVTHYLAVNGRTGATMGSVPINTKKAAAWAWGTAAVVSALTWPIAAIALVSGA